MEVTYKEKHYDVTNPGELLKDSKGYLLDQLDDKLPSMGRYRRQYLYTKYNLTELDYYIIVMLSGSEDNLPKCEFEGCECHKQFNSLLITAKEPIFEIGCCKEHTRILTNRISGRRLIAEGRSPIFKAIAAMKIDDAFREQRRQAALKQVANGKHPWQEGNRSKKILDAQETLRNNLQHNSVEYSTASKTLDDILLNDKITYENRGDENDICYLYITYLDNHPDLVKIGVTIDINSRTKTKYHGGHYINPRILYKSTRIIISNLEYEIKKNFKKDIKLGTESFSKTLENDIIKFIEEQIKFIESSSTTIAESI